MTKFLKHIIIFIFLVTIVSAFLSNLNSSSLSDDLASFEENISLGNVISSEGYMEISYQGSSNIFARLGYLIANFILKFINSVIQLILSLIDKFI
jgi:hypothetical protein